MKRLELKPSKEERPNKEDLLNSAKELLTSLNRVNNDYQQLIRMVIESLEVLSISERPINPIVIKALKKQVTLELAKEMTKEQRIKRK